MVFSSGGHKRPVVLSISVFGVSMFCSGDFLAPFEREHRDRIKRGS